MGRETPVIRIHSASPERTHGLGRALGACLQAGDCVGLRGELGAGKTALAAGLGEGLGVKEAMRSPSYLLCCEHRGRAPVLHLDAYFEARMESLLHEGLASRFSVETVVLVEWADRLEPWWPSDRLDVAIEAAGDEESRWLLLRALGPRSAEVLTAFAARLAEAGIPVESSEPPPMAPR